MKVELRLDKDIKETRVIICAPEENEEIRRLMQRLSKEEGAFVNGYTDRGVVPLREEDIVCIYGERQKVYAETKDGRFLLKERLYELEERMDENLFVRISVSEIVNSRHIVRFDASLTGTICLQLDNGRRTFVARRQVRAIKAHFGL